MAKSVSIFVSVPAGVTLLVFAFAWWLGPDLARLAFLDEQRDQPFTVLDFSDGPEADVYQARYRAPLGSLTASEGGVMLDDYQLFHLLTGSRDHTWRYLARLQVQQARDVAQLTTATPYRMIVNSVPDLRLQMLGSFTSTPHAWRRVVVMWLLGEHVAQQLDPMSPVLSRLSLGDGRLVWDAALTPIKQTDAWQRLVVVDFTDEQQALAWLRHPDVVTARALTNARVRDLMVALYSAQGG